MRSKTIAAPAIARACADQAATKDATRPRGMRLLLQRRKDPAREVWRRLSPSLRGIPLEPLGDAI